MTGELKTELQKVILLVTDMQQSSEAEIQKWKGRYSKLKTRDKEAN